MKQTCKRLIALLLLLSLLCSMLPAVYAAGETATLVTDVSALKAGDQILIVANGYDYAMSTTQNTSNRGQAAVTKSGSSLTYGSDAQIITLETGSVSGTFAFNTGSGYLYAASSSANNLKTTSTLSNNASWAISIDSAGVASIVASGTYTRNVMRYNATSKLFSCYAATNSQKDLSIYKLGSNSGSSGDAALDESCNHDWRNGYCTRCGGAYVEIITAPTGYTCASDVVYNTVNGYIANWGARGEVCTFLSTYAQNFYKSGYTYSELSNLAGGSSASDAPGSALYAAVQTLMVDNHTTFTKYGGSTALDCKNFYQYTDCLKGDPAYVSTIYRGLYVAGAWDGGVTYNQEHVWPHSKCIGTNSTDVGDIMHLRAANPSENSSRNNTAYGESEGYYDPGLSVRGDCARTLLYLYTRWGNTQYLLGTEGVIESVDILLKWIAEDPVDTWEMGHNDAVQSITGTRNVFVDYPELAYQLFGKAAPATLVSPSATSTDYYLFGWINGANYACEEDYLNMGEYKFVNGKLTTTFASDSYVAVKTEGNGAWYMASAYAAEPPATLVVGGNEKLFVPGGVEVTFTLTENADGSLTLSYTEVEPTVDYYLIGYINGANYGCEEDAANLGKYKFVDGKLTATFSCDSYVFVKTGDNAKWYLTSAYAAKPPATLIQGGTEKLFVPGGAEIAFTLTENGNSLILSYVITNCPHNWVEGKTKDATCTEDGETVYTCSICGETKTETIKAAGHDYVYGTCTVCGDKDASYVPTYYLVGYINGANHGCEEDAANMGNYKFVGGKLTVTFSSDSYVFVKTEGNTAWYLAESYVSTPPATLIQGGTEKLFVPGGTEVIFTLTENGDSLTLTYVISNCSHNWNDGVVSKDATCTENGVKTYTCSICGETKTETITAIGHDYEATVTAPNCTEGGYTTYTCLNCSDSYTGNTTAASGHKWNSGVVTKAATCTESGVKTYTCSVCKETKTETIGALDHDYKATVTAPNCTEGGYTTYTCANCDHSYTGNATAATGHKWNSGVVTKAATCTESGVKTYTCSVCKETKTETIGALGHKYVNGTCSVCGIADPNCTHSYTAVVTTAPTCTATGIKTYTCSMCGDVYTETMAALDHSYTAAVTAPTCTAGGYTTYTCENCFHSYTGDATAATGHTYVNGTCTSCGAADPDATTNYYLIGYINGADYGCEGDYENMGEYLFVDGKLTATFDSDSYVFVKTEGNTAWYMATAYVAEPPATLVASGGTEKLFVPGGVEVNFTLTENADGSLTLSYTTSGTVTPDPEPETNYYLVGYINGADYGCEGDYANMGEYLFVDGKLTATFDTASYVFVKTEGNTAWYMATAYVATPPATLVASGGTEKLFVPGGVEVSFNLTENADGSLTLSYTTADIEVIQPTITPKYPSLSFEGEVFYNVTFAATNVDSVAQWGLITFETNVTDGTISNADYIIPGSTYDSISGYYKVRSNGIPAKKLGDTLYFRVYAKLTDGSYVYSGTYNYSAVAYAKDRLANSTNANLKSLCVAMLNYGAAAQTNFGYNTDSLMNSFLTADQQAMVEPYDASMVKSLGSVTTAKAGAFTYTSSAFKHRYPSVSFEGAFAISYYFETAYTPDNGVTLYYWDEATFNSVTTLTADNATGTFPMDLNNATLYKGTIEDIAAKEIDSPVYVAGVYTSGGTAYCTGVLPYSLGAYCVDRAANGSATMQAFAAATAVYGYYAKVYFGVA